MRRLTFESKIVVIIYLLICFILPFSFELSISQIEIDVLHKIYNDTNGKEWNWGNYDPYFVLWSFNVTNQRDPCADYNATGALQRWKGVRCNGTTVECSHANISCTVTDFNLHQNNMVGTLTSEIVKLENLVRLHIDGNKIFGTLPSSISDMTQLKHIDSYNNSFTGTLPDISKLFQLEHLNLGNNKMSGSLAPHIGCLSTLTVIDVISNKFTGIIPESFGDLPGLQYLYLQTNKFTGSIPSSLGKLRALGEIKLHENNLKGHIPSTLSGASSLYFLSLFNNKLTGTIPGFLFESSSLKSLQLQGNKLEGELPLYSPDINNILDTIDISDNTLSGSLSFDFFQFPKLLSFAAGGNCFEGDLPSSMCYSPNVQIFALNGLSSGRKCKRRSLFLSLRAMKGSIPDCIYSLENLIEFYISSNGFTGTLSTFDSYSKIRILSASYNHFSSSIPDQYLRVSNISLDLSHNRFTKTLPQVGTHINYLNLANNRLSGRIPNGVENAGYLDMLIGNLFGCKQSSELPSNDVGRIDVSCGSDDLNRSIFVCISVILLIAVILALLFIFRSKEYWQNCAVIINDALNISLYLGGYSEKLPSVVYFVKLLTILRDDCLRIAFLICLICIPTYSILKSDNVYGGNFKTHTFQYSWYPSAVMLRGIVPALTVCLISTCIFSGVVIMLFPSSFKMITNNKILSYNSLNHILDLKSQYGYLIAFILLGNTIVGFLLNGAYVYVVISHVSYNYLVGLQFLFSICKLIWGNILTSLVLNHLPGLLTSHKLQLLLKIYLFNNILAPIIAFSCVNPSCFLDAILRPGEITATYTIVGQCVGYKVNNSTDVECSETSDVDYNVTYQPEFIYNFQCGNAILTTFSPIFLISSSISIMVIILELLYNYSSWSKYVSKNIADRFAPTDDLLLTKFNFEFDRDIFRPPISDVSSLLNIPVAFAFLYEQIAVLLTFGILCPYVSIIISISVAFHWMKYTVGLSQLFVRMKYADFSDELCKHLEYSCSDFADKMSLKTGWFYSFWLWALVSGLFLTDVAADDSALSWSTAILFCISITCGLVLALYVYSVKFIPKWLLSPSHETRLMSIYRDAEIGIRLTVFHSSSSNHKSNHEPDVN